MEDAEGDMFARMYTSNTRSSAQGNIRENIVSGKEGQDTCRRIDRRIAISPYSNTTFRTDDDCVENGPIEV